MKPRSDSKLLNLREEQQAQLADWLLSGIPYHRAKEMVEKEFGIDVSLMALSRFYSEVCSVALVTRRRRAVQTADEIAAEAARSPGQFDKATIDALSQQAFEFAISPGTDPDKVKAVFSLVLKARDQELKNQQIDIQRRRLELLEKQAAAACGVLADGALTPEQREAKMKLVFGIS